MRVECADFKHFGFATAVGSFESGSPEWLELRQSGIGGSDVAAIMGWSKWTSAYALWASKSGLIRELQSSQAMTWGSLLEPVVRQYFANQNPDWLVVETNATFSFDEKPWMLANPDGFIFKTGDLDASVEDLADVGLLEIKTARYEDDWKDGVPLYYLTQVNWYMHVLGLTWAKVAVLFGGNSFQEFHVDYDPDLAGRMVESAELFWKHVQDGVAPDWDGSTSTYETVRQLHPQIEDSEVELGDLGIHLSLAASQVEEAEAHLREMKSRALVAMGNARYGVVTLDSGEVHKVASRQAKGGGIPYLVVSKGK